MLNLSVYLGDTLRRRERHGEAIRYCRHDLTDWLSVLLDEGARPGGEGNETFSVVVGHRLFDEFGHSAQRAEIHVSQRFWLVFLEDHGVSELGSETWSVVDDALPALPDLGESTQLAALKADSDKLAQSEQARITAEQRAAALATITSQLTAAQRDNASLRADNARLTETLQSVDRDRSARIAQLQQENAAISARLRQAQGTLDSIANAARVLNGGALPQIASSGQVPIRPASASPVSAAPENRYHVVQEGDSLTRISVRYYGTAQRWNEIYDANRDLLRGENALRPGQRLKIP